MKKRRHVFNVSKEKKQLDACTEIHKCKETAEKLLWIKMNSWIKRKY
jgi:hypothetical protein